MPTKTTAVGALERTRELVEQLEGLGGLSDETVNEILDALGEVDQRIVAVTRILARRLDEVTAA